MGDVEIIKYITFLILLTLVYGDKIDIDSFLVFKFNKLFGLIKHDFLY